MPDGQGALLIELNSSSPVNGIALYLFGNDGTTDLYKAYGDSQELASEYIPVNAGNYTLLLVAGADSTALPQETTAPDLAEWLKENGGAYPNLLTASTQTEVKAGEVNQLFLELTDGTSGIHLSTVRLSLSVPGLDLPAYTTTRAGGDSKPLHCVAEVYQAGTNNRIHRRVQECALQSDGTYLAELATTTCIYGRTGMVVTTMPMTSAKSLSSRTAMWPTARRTRRMRTIQLLR